MSICNLTDDWYQEGECEVLVALEDSEEVIILEETHGSISYLEMRSCYTLNQAFKQLRDEWFQFSYLTDFQYLYFQYYYLYTSRSSLRNMTSLAEFANGQYLIRPSTSRVANEGSFDRNSIEHLRSYSWQNWHVQTLWSGMMTVLKNMTCSSRRGTANPLIILARISNNSAAPLNLQVS